MTTHEILHAVAILGLAVFIAAMIDSICQGSETGFAPKPKRHPIARLSHKISRFFREY